MFLNGDTNKLHREIRKQEIIMWRAEEEIKEAQRVINRCKDELRRLENSSEVDKCTKKK